MKHPVTDTKGWPACYGLAHDAADRICRVCPFIETCAKLCRTWAKRPSLSERLAELDEAAKVETDLGDDPHGYGKNVVELYCRIFRNQYGFPVHARARSSDKLWKIMERVQAFCEKEGFDLATYITAQMYYMKPWLESDRNPRKLTFQPNMLLGDNARRRHETYVRVTKRRFKQVTADTRESQSAIGTFIGFLRDDEEPIGSYFIAAAIADDPVEWDVAVDLAAPGKDWKALYLPDDRQTPGVRANRMELARKYGEANIRREAKRARLHAAWRVAARYEHGLPDRIGFTGEFTWDGLAVLLTRLFKGLGKYEHIDLQGVPGVEWGNAG